MTQHRTFFKIASPRWQDRDRNLDLESLLYLPKKKKKATKHTHKTNNKIQTKTKRTHAFLQRKWKTITTRLWHKVTENWHYPTLGFRKAPKQKQMSCAKGMYTRTLTVSHHWWKYSLTKGIMITLRKWAWVGILESNTAALSVHPRCVVRLQQEEAPASLKISPVC